jgi:hypothetical protein
MAGVGAPLMVAWELTGNGKENGKERRGMGAQPRGAAREGRALQEEGHGGAAGLPCLLFPVRVKAAVRGCLLCVRGRKKEEGEEEKKRKRRKRKEKKEKKI